MSTARVRARSPRHRRCMPSRRGRPGASLKAAEPPELEPGMGMADAEMVARAMQGDHDAFAALIGLAMNRLYALACLILRDTDRAEDATQEAIVAAWRELPRLRDPDRFDAWLRRLTVNACYDEARRVRRRAEISLIHVNERTTADSSGAFVEHDRVDRAFR